MVRGDDVFTEPFAELVRDPLGQPARVDEHERGAVLAHVRGDAVEHVRHLLGARDGFELALRQLDREVEGALMTDVDDLRQRPLPDQQPGDRLDRALRGRQPDPDRTRVAQCFEPFEREREVRTALVARDRVDLVDDHHLDRSAARCGRSRS